MASSTHAEGVSIANPLPDLRAIRWAALFLVVADSTDLIVGVFSPGPFVGRPTAADVVQTLFGLGACASLLWWRWRWALPMVVALAAMMLVRQPVGVELPVLVVGAASSAAAAPRRGVPLVLAVVVGSAATLAHALHRDSTVAWSSAALALSLLGIASTAAGLIGGRLVRERESARIAVRELERDNELIRADERRALAAELEEILTHDFDVMRATVDGVGGSDGPTELSHVIARVGEQARSTLATVRVALHTLRAGIDPVPVPSPATPAWIDALHSPRARVAIRLLGLSALALAAAQLAWAAATGEIPATSAAEIVVILGSPLTVVAAVWRERAGVLLAVIVLAVGLTATAPLPWVAIPAGLLCVSTTRRARWWSTGTAVTGLLAYMAATLVRFREDGVTVLAILEGTGACAVLIGLTLGHFDAARRASRSDLDALWRARLRQASDERTGVARELHDVVGHQLSLVSLQALSAEREGDPVVLRDLLRRTDEALLAGEAEIRELVQGLHSTGADPEPLALLAPTAVARALARQLQGHHYDAHFAIDPAVDSLEPATRTTVARILQESGTNVLRHGPPGARCSFAASVTDGTVTMLAHSSLADHGTPSRLSDGYGLRGIRERVDLIGGTFFAGVRSDSWEVQVRIDPARDDETRPALPAEPGAAGDQPTQKPRPPQ